MKEKENKCDKCDRIFGSVQALGLHKYRAHTRNGKDTWGKRKAAKAARKPARRAKHTRAREGVEISYCPCCGTNLRILAHALVTAKELQLGR